MATKIYPGVNFATVTPQEVHELIVAHLTAQGGPCRSADHTCRYRAGRGATRRACAAGVCIPDELYKHAMEGDYFLARRSVWDPVARALAQNPQRDIVRWLVGAHQRAHDSMDGSRASFDAWRCRARALGAQLRRKLAKSTTHTGASV